MTYTISNSFFEVKVQGKGAELSSIKSQGTGREYIWEANPKVWGSHAPVLFPIIGALKNGECEIKGTKYAIPKHGFIRNNAALELKNISDNEVCLQLEHSEHTLKMYPFKFRFEIKFRLEGRRLHVSHRVFNLDTQEIFFSLGAHPGFKCPVNEGENYSDYYLEFENVENASARLLNSNGLVSDETQHVLKNTNLLPLTSTMFDKDALMFTNLKSRKVSLKSHTSDQVLTVEYKDFSYLGIWAKPNAPFICIEPWLGLADHENSGGNFLKKDGLIALQEGKIFEAEYAINIEE